MKMMRVDKREGSLPWHVVNEANQTIRRTATKKRASLLCALLNGDLSVASIWYRAEFEHWLKIATKNRYREPHLTAAMYAVQDARLFNLTPAQVQCDPKTGIPNERG
jgi:hypothetical protein